MVSTGERGGITRCPGLHMAPRSGVPLECIQCTTFSQRAGWGPSHSLWPPVPLSFSATKPPSCLCTVTVEVGGGVEESAGGQLDQGTAGLSSKTGEKSAGPWERFWGCHWFRSHAREGDSSFGEPGGRTRWGRPRP